MAGEALHLKDPEFSRHAAHVLGSPYWYQDYQGPPGVKEYLAHEQARFAEREQLEEALGGADTYEGLPPAARAIFDRAEAYGERWEMEHQDEEEEEEEGAA